MRRGFVPILVMVVAMLFFIVSGGAYLLGKSHSSGLQSYIPPVDNQLSQPSSPSFPDQPYLEPLSSKAVWLTENLVWDVTDNPVSLSELQPLQDAFRKVGVIDTAQRNSYFVVTSGKFDEDWGIFYAVEKPKPPETFQTTATLTIIAHKVKGVWKVSKEDDADFCNDLKAIPDNVMDSKDYFVNCK